MAFFALLSCVLVIGAYGQEQEEYEYEPEEYEISDCEDGLLLPLWRRDSAGRGVVCSALLSSWNLCLHEQTD